MTVPHLVPCCCAWPGTRQALSAVRPRPVGQALRARDTEGYSESMSRDGLEMSRCLGDKIDKGGLTWADMR